MCCVPVDCVREVRSRRAFHTSTPERGRKDTFLVHDDHEARVNNYRNALALLNFIQKDTHTNAPTDYHD
jgi:hypothetical protein